MDGSDKCGDSEHVSHSSTSTSRSSLFSSEASNEYSKRAKLVLFLRRRKYFLSNQNIFVQWFVKLISRLIDVYEDV